MALAIELYASNPSLTIKEVAAKCSVDKKTITNWLTNVDFLDNLYKRYMELAGSQLPSVIQATIGEAQRGNVQAARLVLEHFGKLENKIRVQVESNFERFMKVDADQVDFIDVEEEDSEFFDKIAETLVEPASVNIVSVSEKSHHPTNVDICSGEKPDAGADPEVILFPKPNIFIYYNGA